MTPTACAARNCCLSIGSVGQHSGVASVNRASTVARRRASRRTPVTGSNRPVRFHMPSPSTQDRSRVARRCRSSRLSPSSRSSRLASRSTRRVNCSTVDAPATAARVSTRSSSSGPRSPSRRAARVTASMCPAVVWPALSVSASRGVACNVSARSLTLPAVASEVRSTCAIVASGNDDTADSRPISAARRASIHPVNSRTATNPASTADVSASRSSHAASIRRTRSMAAANPCVHHAHGGVTGLAGPEPPDSGSPTTHDIGVADTENSNTPSPRSVSATTHEDDVVGDADRTGRGTLAVSGRRSAVGDRGRRRAGDDQRVSCACGRQRTVPGGPARLPAWPCVPRRAWHAPRPARHRNASACRSGERS